MAWEKFVQRPWPKAGDRHIIGREQEFNTDSRNKAKILLGTKDGELLSIWPSQMRPIAEYFVKHPKAKECQVIWKAVEREDGRILVVASVEALDA